jgi:translation initiation factor IF-3
MAISSPPGGGARPRDFQRRNTDPFANIRRNHRIKALQIRVISPEGRQLGIMDTSQALRLATQFNLDLVEVAPTAQPPVCRIMDFGKYVYEESKKHAHSKPAAGKIKEIEFTVRIENNDFLTKLRHAEEFLDHGNKVKLRLKFRGREMAHTEMGFEVIKKALGELINMGHPDSEPKLAGKQLMVMLTPLPANKRKPKFHVRESNQPPANHESERAAPPSAPPSPVAPVAAPVGESTAV